MKHLPLLLLFPALAQAAPFLEADPYPNTGPQPDAAAFTINGGTPIQCSLQAVTGGLKPRCDLASITTPGTYTLVMTVSSQGGCTNTANAATCANAGSVSSAPFAFTLRGSSAATPILRVAP